MIDYQTYCQIRRLFIEKGLGLRQIARQLKLGLNTVRKWAQRESYQRAPIPKRASKLDPFKGQIVALLEQHDYSAQQIFQRMKEAGYQGRCTILRAFVQQVRPKPRPAFLTLHFEPGQCAQVDWGCAGSVPVGSTHRRLSFFLMVLAFCRKMYLEFTLAETLEHFLSCHQHAFQYFGGVVSQVWVDNCKVAVLSRAPGSIVFNPHYLDFANHHGFQIRACGVGQPQEKGRVENGVAYVKKNFLHGLELSDFALVNPAARYWLDTVANVRIHGQTHKTPQELFTQEKLKPLHSLPYEAALVETVRVNNQFRIKVDGNRYSVPCRYASSQLSLKRFADRLLVYDKDKLVAEHVRRYDRNQDYELPDHVAPLLLHRQKAREQKLFLCFLALCPQAHDYYQQLEQRRLNPKHHVQKIVALSELYGADAVARALEDAFTYQAFSCEYIANLLQQRQHPPNEPGALHLTRQQDLLELELPAPDLSLLRQQLQKPSRLHSAMKDDQLQTDLLHLKLSYFREHYQALANEAAEKNWTPLDLLSRLVEGEALRRKDRATHRRLQAARFPLVKTLEQFDWTWPKKINRPHVQNLFRLSFVQDKANVIFMGGAGLGKSHLATALAYEACLAGHTVLFTTAIDIVNTLAAAQSTHRLKAELRKYTSPSIALIDELGYLPIDKTGADLLFQVFSQRYENGSTILTTNQAYKHWAKIFNNDATLTSAVLDRLLHHAETVTIEGKSYRMKDQIEEP